MRRVLGDPKFGCRDQQYGSGPVERLSPEAEIDREPDQMPNLARRFGMRHRALIRGRLPALVRSDGLPSPALAGIDRAGRAAGQACQRPNGGVVLSRSATRKAKGASRSRLSDRLSDRAYRLPSRAGVRRRREVGDRSPMG